MNDRVLRERLDSSRFNDVFIKIHAYGPTPKFPQELELDCDLVVILKSQHFQIPIRSGLLSSTLLWASGSGDRASTPCVWH